MPAGRFEYRGQRPCPGGGLLAWHCLGLEARFSASGMVRPSRRHRRALPQILPSPRNGLAQGVPAGPAGEFSRVRDGALFPRPPRGAMGQGFRPGSPALPAPGGFRGMVA